MRPNLTMECICGQMIGQLGWEKIDLKQHMDNVLQFICYVSLALFELRSAKYVLNSLIVYQVLLLAMSLIMLFVRLRSTIPIEAKVRNTNI